MYSTLLPALRVFHNAIAMLRKAQSDIRSRRLHHFRHGWRRQLGAKDAVPEAAGHAKAVLVVHEVMLEVILLELAVVGGKTV